MRLLETPMFPGQETPMGRALSGILKSIVIKVNQLAEGAIAGADKTATSVPATGAWKTGDFVRKSDPVEAGSVSSRYVITGWIRVTDGSANVLGTDWLEVRALTGN